MKLLLALFMIVCIFSGAAAQEGAAPAQPAASRPAMPSQDKPAMPSQDKPAMPSQDKPAMPSQAKPAMPSKDEPAMPPADKPDQPGRISEWVDTTPENLRSPESSHFWPFHVPGSTLTFLQPVGDKELTIDKKTGIKRLYTPTELKRQQSLELKTLRRSLINTRNSEIEKAVKAREAEHKTEIKSLENRIRAESQKNQKVPAAQKAVVTQPSKAE